MTGRQYPRGVPSQMRSFILGKTDTGKIAAYDMSSGTAHPDG